MSLAQAIEGGGLRIEFRRSGDRFGHAIVSTRGAAAAEVLSSIEGPVDQVWPASPPLQELHIEDRPGNVKVALLVGMAGTSHWSLSCSLDPASSSATFDVACRAREQPIWLGSSYYPATTAVIEADTVTIALPEEHGCWHVRSEHPLETDADCVRIAAPYPAANWPRTICWKYHVRRGVREALPP